MKHPTNPFSILYKKILSLFKKNSQDRFLSVYLNQVNNENFVQRIVRQGRLSEYQYHLPK